jgi:signal transduction histidine kinase
LRATRGSAGRSERACLWDLLAVIGLLGLLFLALPAWGQPLELSRAEFVLSESAQPPGDTAAWQAQALPDRWRVSRPGEGGSGWYRLTFHHHPPAGELQAVYLPKLCLNAEVWLNGVLIGSGGRFEEPIARNWNRPLLFLIPPGLLNAGDNRLFIRLRSHAYTQASLFPPQLGPEQELRPKYERAYFLRISLNQVASLMIAAIGLLMLSFWWRRRQDTAYGYFGVSALVWSAQSTNLYIRDVPLPTVYWEVAYNASFQIFAALLLISLLRYIKADWRPLNRLLMALLLVSPPAMALAPSGWFLSVTAGLHFLSLIAAIGTLGLLIHAAWRQRNHDARLLLAAMGLIVLFAGHDWLLHSKHLWHPDRLPWLPGDVYLLHYSAPVVFLVIGWIMSARFISVLNEFEALNAELDQRVRDKHAQLEASYARMAELEREQAVREERERIHGDLHDDVGAKLLSLVYQAATPASAELARSALQDLRDVVSRTTADSFELDEVLADWRAECEQRLTAAGLRLVWQQTGELAAIRLNQPQALNMLRFLREAISNVIHHAQAASVSVSCNYAQGELCMDVRDDGIGCDLDQPGRGRGLRNMAARAQRIGARLERYRVEPSGCGVSLRVPLG